MDRWGMQGSCPCALRLIATDLTKGIGRKVVRCGSEGPTGVVLYSNWLRVLGPTERAQVDQHVCHQLHAIMPLLDAFKAEQHPLELVFPRKGPLNSQASRMDGGVEQPLAPALGRL